MKEYNIITTEDTSDLSMWLEEYNSSFQNGFWNYNVSISNFCQYSHLRDAIFNSRLWGVMEKENEEIIGVFLILTDIISNDCTAMRVEAYLSNDIELYKFGIKKIKEIFYDDYSKVKFTILLDNNQKSTNVIFQMPGLKEETSISLGKRNKNIYSLFL